MLVTSTWHSLRTLLPCCLSRGMYALYANDERDNPMHRRCSQKDPSKNILHCTLNCWLQLLLPQPGLSDDGQSTVGSRSVCGLFIVYRGDSGTDALLLMIA